MHQVFELAKDYGIEIVFADLGDWGRDELRSEYDPEGPVIRVNARAIERVAKADAQNFIAFAVAHELYHHREHRGEVARLAGRAQREAAADEFARSLLAPAT